MRDRVSTKILDNGATRYGVYDETGKLLRYEYIKLEDEPDEEGDFFNKANMLPDHIPALLGLKMGNPQVKDALNVLANIGNVYVWAKSIETSETIPESYKLEGEYTINLFGPYASGSATAPLDLSWTYASTVVVSNGTISMGPDKTTKKIATNKTGSLPSEIVGKFVKINGSIYYCPSTATMNTRVVGSYYTDIVGINGVVYVPAVPAGIHTEYLTSTDSTAYPQDGDVGDYHYTYLGQLGDKARIEVGSYVGTGTYGKSNPNTLTLEFEPKLIVITEKGYGVNPLGSQWNNSVILVQGSYSMYVQTSKLCKFNVAGKNATWYTEGSTGFQQLNSSGTTYNYIAIG